MKCDELKRKYSDITGPYYGYNEVNEAIAELKAENERLNNALDKERSETIADYYLKSEADKVIAEKDAVIEEQAKEIKFMHQHCQHGEHCGTSCAQIHGELMQATIEIAELKNRIAPKQSDKTLQERLNEVCKKQ